MENIKELNKFLNITVSKNESTLRFQYLKTFLRAKLIFSMATAYLLKTDNRSNLFNKKALVSVNLQGETSDSADVESREAISGWLR